MAASVWEFLQQNPVQLHVVGSVCCAHKSRVTRLVLFVQGELDVLGQVRAKR